MYRMLIVIPFTVLLLSACIVTPEERVVVAPALPVIVELDAEPYYYQHGYYYYYDHHYWSYSRSRSGPWLELPRSHYPKEIRYRGRGDGRDRDRDRDRDYDRDHRDRRY
jgi:hypothetical protein